MSDVYVAEARRIGIEVAGVFADEVDRLARFPAEAVAEFRRSGLLSASVPEEWGGAGASLQTISKVVSIIAEYCASSALVLAMHHIQVASLVRHASPALAARVLPAIAAGELLLANANSEVGAGGNYRSSICALTSDGSTYHLDKNATTVSYGEFADGVLATARPSEESPANEQVVAVCIGADYRLEPSGEWDTLGLRGTCSRPAHLVADIAPEFVIMDYAHLFLRTWLPVSVILLSSVWVGIAEGAARVAHRNVRDQAHRDINAASPSPSAFRLAELSVRLQQMRDSVYSGIEAYERVKDTPEVETLRFTNRMETVKLTTSTTLTDVVTRALAICGIGGYKNGTPTSLGRYIRDAAAAPVMVNNDRVLWTTAQSLSVSKEL